MKIFQSKLSLILILIAFTFASNAQQMTNQLFIHNIKNNSYYKVIAFQPYAILTDNNEVLRGYFDAVYDETFLFATKDSVYVLKPDNIKGVAETDGYRGNPNSTSQKSNSALHSGGAVLITIGTIMLPSALIAIFDNVSAGVVLTAITGGLIGGGIAMINTASKRKKSSQTSAPAETLRNNKNQLRIIKSPL